MSTFLAGSMPGGDPDHRCALPTSWPLQDPRVHKEVEHECKAGARAGDDDDDHQHWHDVQEEAGEASKEPGHRGEFAPQHRGDLWSRTKSYFRLVVFKLVSQKLICNPAKNSVGHAKHSETLISFRSLLLPDDRPARCILWKLPSGQNPATTLCRLCSFSKPNLTSNKCWLY